jgi:hypothetical protein
MPQRSLLRRTAQRALNSIVAALLLLTAPVLVPGDPSPPPRALVALGDSATADQLALQLPAAITFSDRMGAAVIGRLPAALSVRGAVRVEAYRAGDVAYVASEQSVVVFLTDGSAVPDGGLILLGHVTSGMDDLARCVRDCAVELGVMSQP